MSDGGRELAKLLAMIAVLPAAVAYVMLVTQFIMLCIIGG